MENNIEKKLQEISAKLKSSRHIRPQKKIYYQFSLLVEMIAGLITGVFLGYWLDKYLNTLPFFLFIFSILGIAAGLYNGYNVFNKTSRDYTIKNED